MDTRARLRVEHLAIGTARVTRLATIVAVIITLTILFVRQHLARLEHLVGALVRIGVRLCLCCEDC